MTAFMEPGFGLMLLGTLVVAGCGDRLPTEARGTDAPALSAAQRRSLAAEVRALAQARNITPMPPRPEVREGLVRLGQMLAFDRILSGNEIELESLIQEEVTVGRTPSWGDGWGAVGEVEVE